MPSHRYRETERHAPGIGIDRATPCTFCGFAWAGHPPADAVAGFLDAQAAFAIEAGCASGDHALAMNPEGGDWCLRDGCTFKGNGGA